MKMMLLFKNMRVYRLVIILVILIFWLGGYNGRWKDGGKVIFVLWTIDK